MGVPSRNPWLQHPCASPPLPCTALLPLGTRQEKSEAEGAALPGCRLDSSEGCAKPASLSKLNIISSNASPLKSGLALRCPPPSGRALRASPRFLCSAAPRRFISSSVPAMSLCILRVVVAAILLSATVVAEETNSTSAAPIPPPPGGYETPAPEQGSGSGDGDGGGGFFSLTLGQKAFVIGGTFALLLMMGVCYCSFRYRHFSKEEMRSTEALAQSLQGGGDVESGGASGAAAGQQRGAVAGGGGGLTGLPSLCSAEQCRVSTPSRRGSLLVINSGSSGMEPRGSGSSLLSGNSVMQTVSCMDATLLEGSTARVAPPSRKKKGVTFTDEPDARKENDQSPRPLPPLHPSRGKAHPLSPSTGLLLSSPVTPLAVQASGDVALRGSGSSGGSRTGFPGALSISGSFVHAPTSSPVAEL